MENTNSLESRELIREFVESQQISKEISYREHLFLTAEKRMDKLEAYIIYLSEQLEKSISYSEYLAEVIEENLPQKKVQSQSDFTSLNATTTY